MREMRKEEILRVIAKTSGFDYDSISYCYNQVKSFDKTIKIIDLACETGISIHELLNLT